MRKRAYVKTALEIPQQIQQLRNRGLIITDEDYASKVLSSINYYRLSGYWMHYEEERDVFKPGITFEKVMELYDFDRDLRTLIFEGISRFEVSLRTRWAYETGMKYGPQAFFESAFCKNEEDRIGNIRVTKSEVKRSKEAFIRHFVDTYTGSLPASWIACEVMSFGNLSCWYTNLKEVRSSNPASPGNAKDSIAKYYGIDSRLLVSWIHSIVVLRNLCAHQSRIVNKKFSVFPAKPKSDKSPIKKLWTEEKDFNKPYNLILVLIYLNKKIDSPSDWLDRMISFLKNNKEKCVEFLSFPNLWETDSFWN